VRVSSNPLKPGRLGIRQRGNFRHDRFMVKTIGPCKGASQRAETGRDQTRDNSCEVDCTLVQNRNSQSQWLRKLLVNSWLCSKPLRERSDAEVSSSTGPE
jgi:hypothetical protein